MNSSPGAKGLALGLATFLLTLALAARADLYWCQKGNNSALVEQKVEGSECRLVQKDDPPAAEDSGKEPVATAPAQPRSPATSLDGEAFPVVSPEEQLDRDQTRAAILQLELQDESQKLKDLRELIQRNQQTSGNKQVHDFYVRRFERHLQNIKALRQEIAGLP